jgi:hypothetical protein
MSESSQTEARLKYALTSSVPCKPTYPLPPRDQEILLDAETASKPGHFERACTSTYARTFRPGHR